MILNKDKFKIIGYNENDSEAIVRPNIGYWADAWRRLKKNPVAMASLIVLVVVTLACIIIPFLSPYGLNDQNYDILDKSASIKHLFGTDNLGRDLFLRTWKGGRVSLIIGFVGTLVELIIGLLYGGIAGYIGGKVDTVMMRIIEIVSSLPFMLIIILLLLVLSPGITTIIIALVITGWMGIARLIRGQVMQLKNSEYVMAAVALGSSPLRVILKHLLPNTLGVILVYLSFDVPDYIFSEAFLSYIGLGIQSPNTSWGLLISEGQGNLTNYPHEIFFPTAILFVTVLAFNLLGDGLRDALDPKLRQ
ncbi:ABC transporter permease [Clostridium sp. 19966]|uniref:ABC transporter permease n=1 Tax=Clostridium sp. 19966 TaxID=2768166 RepID=UPI0028DE4E30|nr:ABC transporter permease [Clostridium sp. 19966]MDT8716538.1 ABC transporter permease [Clostridium sp. 19966]